MDEHSEVTRRGILRLAAMAGGVVLTGALVGCDREEKKSASPVVGQGTNAAATPSEALDGAPPVVDRLAVWVLVDNAHDVFLKSATIGDINVRCDVQRNGLGVGPKLKNQLQSEFGLGFHLESARGAETRNFLLDFGLSTTAGLANMDFLKIDPASVDALILSHGHYDHFGGLLPLLSQYREKMRPDLPLFVGGEDTFCYRWIQPPPGRAPDLRGP